MRYTATEYDVSQIPVVESGLSLPAQARPPGLHLSDIIRYVDNKVVHPGQRVSSDRLSPQERQRAGAYWEMGYIWESMVETFFMARMMKRLNLVKQAPTQFKGVWMTPDAFDLTEWRLHEFKATWMTIRRAEEDFEGELWNYLAQIKGYCLAMDTFDATLWVFWVNGNYKESGPKIMRYDLEFTAEDLQDNWNMLAREAKHVEAK